MVACTQDNLLTMLLPIATYNIKLTLRGWVVHVRLRSIILWIVWSCSGWRWGCSLHRWRLSLCRRHRWSLWLRCRNWLLYRGRGYRWRRCRLFSPWHLRRNLFPRNWRGCIKKIINEQNDYMLSYVEEEVLGFLVGLELNLFVDPYNSNT